MRRRPGARPRRVAPAALLIACATGLAACGSGGGSASTTRPAAVPATTTPVHVPATNTRTALLNGVRAAPHAGFDRVVFQFRNTLPGYDVRYVPRPVHEDGSGRLVPVKGAAVARIRMENALDADLTKSTAPRTYTGPLRFSPGTPEVAELARSGGFEGILTWVAGVHGRDGFRVTTLAAPPRLIVDFPYR